MTVEKKEVVFDPVTSTQIIASIEKTQSEKNISKISDIIIKLKNAIQAEKAFSDIEKKIAKKKADRLKKAFATYYENVIQGTDSDNLAIWEINPRDVRLAFFLKTADFLRKQDAIKPVSPLVDSDPGWSKFTRQVDDILNGKNPFSEYSDMSSSSASSTPRGETSSREQNGAMSRESSVSTTDDSKLTEERISQLVNYDFDMDEMFYLKPVIESIEAMHAYSKKLHEKDASHKGLIGMNLAVKLFEKLQSYNPDWEPEQRQSFSNDFAKLLRSENKAMDFHRTPWKHIVGNVFIALSVVGLIPLALKFLITGKGFFATTKSSEILADVKDSYTNTTLNKI